MAGGPGTNSQGLWPDKEGQVTLVPTLCVGTYSSGRSAPYAADIRRMRNVVDAERPAVWVPTQSMGTRITAASR